VLVLALLGASRAYSDTAGCERPLLKLDARALAEGLKTYRESVIAGYHLPSNYTTAYFERRVLPYLERPNYLENKNPDILYRGMYRNIDQLITQLEKGHELNKVRWTTVGGGVSFSTSEQEASTYIFHNADGRPEGVGVLFAFKKQPYMTLIDDPVHNPTNTIYKAQQDVPPEDLVDVYLWGQWGFERLSTIIEKARQGKITPHTDWTGQFDRAFNR
jgi:hypothetical protein